MKSGNKHAGVDGCWEHFRNVPRGPVRLSTPVRLTANKGLTWGGQRGGGKFRQTTVRGGEPVRARRCVPENWKKLARSRSQE